MTQKTTPIIVGAGPVGLAAALFLARQGIFPRIIDSAPHAAPHSKALAVNPRTLEILEPTGVTDQMLSIGKRIHSVRISAGAKIVAQMSLSSLKHKFPFMLALSQAVTVRLLEAALNRAGNHVEWNCQLVRCQTHSDGAQAELKSTTDGSSQTLRCPWLLAADGAHSTVRQSLGIEFKGSSFENPWYLTDVPLSTSLAQDMAHIFFLPDGGFLFLIRVIDEPASQAPGDPLWRVIGNFPDLLPRLEAGKPTGRAVWTSSFHISHRINRRLQQGAVCFAGDAAHLHSPMGARGMNLGIEDAWVFAQCVAAGRLADYGKLRFKIDRSVVRRIELVSRLVRGESAGSRLLRKLFPMMTRIPIMRNRFLEAATGLDHPIPAMR
jgi:2-polyprenyl-6-methoxyphenol hydroxylase-like FAD-dependent oxidoreductase